MTVTHVKSSLKSFEEVYMAKHTEQVRAGSAETKGSTVKACKHHSTWRNVHHMQGGPRTVIRRQKISSVVSENTENKASRRHHSHSGRSGHTQILSDYGQGSIMST